MSQHLTIIANVRGKIRRIHHKGRQYLVAPMRMIVPGVLNGNKGPILYVPEENSKSRDLWNYMPIVVNHPFRPDGRAGSAKDKGVLRRTGIGFVANTRDGKFLDAEGWFDIEKTKKVDYRIFTNLVAKRPIELSTGLFMDYEPATPGAVHNGVPYKYIARNYRPDHLAVLPDEEGACSLKDGCGVLVNSKLSLIQRVKNIIFNYNPSQPRDNQGQWSSGGGSGSAAARGGKGGSKPSPGSLGALAGKSSKYANSTAPGTAEFKKAHEQAAQDHMDAAEAYGAVGESGNQALHEMEAESHKLHAEQPVKETPKPVKKQKPVKEKKLVDREYSKLADEIDPDAAVSTKKILDGGFGVDTSKTPSFEELQKRQSDMFAREDAAKKAKHEASYQETQQQLSETIKRVEAREAAADSKANVRAEAMSELIKEKGSVQAVTAKDLKERIQQKAFRPATLVRGPVKGSNISVKDLETQTGGKLLKSQARGIRGGYINPTNSISNLHIIEHTNAGRAAQEYQKTMENSGLPVSQVSKSRFGFKVSVRDLEAGVSDHIEFRQRKGPTTNKALVSRVAAIVANYSPNQPRGNDGRWSSGGSGGGGSKASGKGANKSGQSKKGGGATEKAQKEIGSIVYDFELEYTETGENGQPQLSGYVTKPVSAVHTEIKSAGFAQQPSGQGEDFTRFKNGQGHEVLVDKYQSETLGHPKGTYGVRYHPKYK